VQSKTEAKPKKTLSLETKSISLLDFEMWNEIFLNGISRNGYN
jgi:hypothetical protein